MCSPASYTATSSPVSIRNTVLRAEVSPGSGVWKTKVHRCSTAPSADGGLPSREVVVIGEVVDVGEVVVVGDVEPVEQPVITPENATSSATARRLTRRVSHDRGRPGAGYVRSAAQADVGGNRPLVQPITLYGAVTPCKSRHSGLLMPPVLGRGTRMGGV